MEHKMKKSILTVFTILCVALSATTTAFASEAENNVFDEAVIIGQYDGLLSDCWDPSVPMPRAAINVRVNSYATYDKDDGIQVKVKLYVPALEFPKPQFTSMTGTVTVTMSSKTTNKSFAKYANGDSTIETDVNTGRTGKSGTQGTVVVSGVATANNALNGGGAFAISYAVTIP